MSRDMFAILSLAAAAAIAGYLYGRYPVRVPDVRTLRARLMRAEGIAAPTASGD